MMHGSALVYSLPNQGLWRLVRKLFGGHAGGLLHSGHLDYPGWMGIPQGLHDEAQNTSSVAVEAAALALHRFVQRAAFEMVS